MGGKFLRVARREWNLKQGNGFKREKVRVGVLVVIGLIKFGGIVKERIKSVWGWLLDDGCWVMEIVGMKFGECCVCVLCWLS